MWQQLTQGIEQNWYSRRPGLNLLLLPLWLLAAPVIYWKRYQALENPVEKLRTPVVVVGNITVGGTGKTPLITYLVNRVQALGYRAGIISRGYGGEAPGYPLLVTNGTAVDYCGDEPKLLQQRLQCPVVVDPQRRRAASLLDGEVDIIFSDDGLQHYGLGRDGEILVVDGERGFGNGWLLPVGPLREPVSRADSVDVVLTNGSDFSVHAARLINASSGRQQPLSWLEGRAIQAVAGIGNPQRFYRTLEDLGARVEPHSFADHHEFKARDFNFPAASDIVMTEKDWVKCRAFATENMWYLAVDAQLTSAAEQQLDVLLKQLLSVS